MWRTFCRLQREINKFAMRYYDLFLFTLSILTSPSCRACVRPSNIWTLRKDTCGCPIVTKFRTCAGIGTPLMLSNFGFGPTSGSGNRGVSISDFPIQNDPNLPKLQILQRLKNILPVIRLNWNFVIRLVLEDNAFYQNLKLIGHPEPEIRHPRFLNFPIQNYPNYKSCNA